MSDNLCPACGETDPMPNWVCVHRMIGAAEPNKPCPDSREGMARTLEALWADALPPIPSDTGEGKP